MLVSRKHPIGPTVLLQRLKGLLVLTMTLCAVQRAVGQQLVLPVTIEGEPSVALTIDDLRLSVTADSHAVLDMQFCLVGKLGRDERLLLQPRLSARGHEMLFPAVEVSARWAYYHTVRRNSPATAGGTLQFRDKEVTTPCPYLQAVPFEPWMQEATLTLTATRNDGCGTTLTQTRRTAMEPTVELRQRQDEGWKDTRSDRLRGTAYVTFPVAKTELLPDFGQNRRELSELCAVVDSLRRLSHVTIHSVSIKGYASPEGSFASNDRLARERTESLARYLSDHCSLPLQLIATDHVAEDWGGLRRYVEQSTMPQREALLRIIDSPLEPDARLTMLAQSFPQLYKRLSDEVFPRLRHTDYEIDYTARTVTEHRGSTHTDTLRRLAYTATDGPAPVAMTRRLPSFRPWVALKTNVLYDLALAPNIEVEVPLGRNARWSLLAETTWLWWRFGHNPKGEQSPYYRSDQRPTRHSRELAYAGGELRCWLSPRCDDARPVLSGLFVGIYGAAGYYDWEHDSEGDQGECVSAGLSLGYSWPLGRHWNLELSAAAGYVGGPRRHYEAEFDDARLIHRYTSRLNYVGPTKLKLALVWLLGKKGGAR